MKLILASQSPRRSELLEQAGFEFQPFPVKVSEIIDENLKPEVQVSQLATRKAEACLMQHKSLNSQEFLILGADTMVVEGDQCLGKPRNFSEAEQFLRRLSGKTHRVITGVSLIVPAQGPRWEGYDSTEVSFHKLSDQQILEYVQTGEPMDKAGAYAIQGVGKQFVSSIRGSWSNVVGLPLEKLERILKEQGWHVPRKKTIPT